MKRYFIYALILGALGHTMLSNASTNIAKSSTQAQIEALGE